jgi:two-component system, sensor histidine kinase and response regulator
VLVAEDNLVNLEVAQFYLEDLGCVPAAAINGAEAVAMAKCETFDFILMDCQMPVMDGFAALQAIRALGAANANATAPILAVTAADDEQSKRNCLRAGFDGFLAKPFTTDQLRAALLGELSHAAKVATPQSDAVPLLDATAFAAFVGDFGLDTAPSLLASYVKLLGESLSRFDQCLTASDTVGLQALGHKLVGASGTVGARKLQAIAKDIDARGKKKQLQFTPEVCVLRDDISATKELLAPLVTEAALGAFLAQRTTNA